MTLYELILTNSCINLVFKIIHYIILLITHYFYFKFILLTTITKIVCVYIYIYMYIYIYIYVYIYKFSIKKFVINILKYYIKF